MRSVPMCLAAVVVAAGCGTSQPRPAAKTASIASASASVPARKPPYPPRFPHIAGSEVSAREQAFRKKNPEPWTYVNFDQSGLLVSAAIVGPTPTAMPTIPEYDDAKMAAQWSAFVERNRDILGADAPGMQLVSEKSSVGYRQLWGNYVIGWAMVSWSGVSYSGGQFGSTRISVGGHGWPVVGAAPDEKSDAELLAPFIGLRGTRTTGFQVHKMPCDPPGAGQPNPCGKMGPPPPPPPPNVGPYTLSRENVHVGPHLVCHFSEVAGTAVELRIISHLTVRVPHASPQFFGGGGISSASSFVPDDGAALPSKIDVVTGRALGPGRCAEGY